MIYLFVFNYFCFRVHYLLTSAIQETFYDIYVKGRGMYVEVLAKKEVPTIG